ncbi:hypothetical protein BSG1_09763 [Bacillus sp. SG-1]|nr:hypothetical protein BSG1_09763 [Bacillus sp. SG-1]
MDQEMEKREKNRKVSKKMMQNKRPVSEKEVCARHIQIYAQVMQECARHIQIYARVIQEYAQEIGVCAQNCIEDKIPGQKMEQA